MNEPVRTPADRYSQSILALMVAIAVFVVGSGTLTFISLISVKETADQVRSCTVSTGRCYRDNVRRSGGAVDSINVYTLAANICSDKFDGDTAILTCIENYVKERNNGSR